MDAKDQPNAVYAERNKLVALLSKVFPAHLQPDVDEEEEWQQVVCIHLPTGQATWHIHDSEIPLFAHLEIGENHWDGHDNDEKYRRVNRVLPPRHPFIPEGND